MVAALFLLLSPSFACSQQANSKEESKTGAQAQAVRRITVDAKVMRKKLIRKTIPDYPVEARKRFVQGTVVLSVLVGVDGRVKDVRYISGPRLLAQAAMDGVRQWIYRPTEENGEPVEVETRVETDFELRN
jgi:protein TonB